MKLRALASLAALLLISACTIRHSRMLDSASPKGVRRVTASSSGLEILSIEINDTESTASLLKQAGGQCRELKNVDVDYRTTLYCIVGIPKLTVSADCD